MEFSEDKIVKIARLIVEDQGLCSFCGSNTIPDDRWWRRGEVQCPDESCEGHVPYTKEAEQAARDKIEQDEWYSRGNQPGWFSGQDCDRCKVPRERKKVDALVCPRCGDSEAGTN